MTRFETNPGGRQNDVVPLFDRAAALFQSGRLAEAKRIARRILADQPKHTQALHLLGVALSQQGNHTEGLRFIDAAMQVDGKSASIYNSRGNILLALQRFDAAVRSYEQAIALKSDFAEPFCNRGAALHELKRFDEALASYDKAIALRPDDAEAFCNRGLALQELERFDTALASYDKAIALTPGYAEAFYNRGLALQRLKRFEEALVSYDQAIALKPDFAEAFCNRGGALKDLKRLKEALASYDQAIALKPNVAEAFYSRGVVLQDLKRFDEALANYDQAIARKPGYAEAFSNRSTALCELNRLDEALANYDDANSLRPDYADGYWNRALLRLLMGRYDEGWTDYERRWEAKDFPSKRPSVNAPTWLGEEIAGKQLLVFSEQGLGDVIQFVRYLPLLAERKCKVTFLAPAILVSLLRRSITGIEIVSALRGGERFDFQIALMSLPLIFSTRLENIPARIPYLFAPPDCAKAWQQRLLASPVPRIGICWAGNPAFPKDQLRSIGLPHVIPMLSVPGVQFISLQKDLRAGDEELLRQHPRLIHLGGHLDNFTDTATIMSLLDLVISSDTAPVHLAGALGRPVWVLLQHIPDWRWLLNREDSPWYPSARLFRQPSAGDWNSVVAKVIEQLNLMPSA